MFTRSSGAGLLLLLCTSLATGQVPRQTHKPLNVPAAPAGVLAGFHVTKGTLQDLVLPKTNVRGFTVTVVLGGKACVLILREHDIRSANFKLMVHDNNGLHVVPAPANTTYRGMVGGYQDSIVAASLVSGQLRALVQLGKGKAFWGIQPVSEVNQTAKPSTHIVYHSTMNNVPAARCGVTDENGPPPPPPSFNLMAANKVCEIGCDADWYLYRAKGYNVTATQNDVTSVMNGVATIYKRDVGIDYKITQIIVRTTRVYSSTSVITLLSQFASRWNTFHAGVKRDTAHLFHGGTGGGVIGVSTLATICKLSSSYGVSKTAFTSNFTSRVGLTAHELGHAWSARHCDGRNPCNIMCSGLGGCSRNITSFGSYSQSFIKSFRDSRTCLSLAATGPVLTSVSPTSVQAFKGGTITLTGSKFTNATAVNVGTNTLTTQNFKIVNDTRITFESFTPPSLAPVLVNVRDINGTSANKTLNYTATSPPKLESWVTGAGRGVLLWQFGARPSHLWFLTVSLSNQTTSLLGFNWLTTPVLLTSGTLDAAGAGGWGVVVPNNAPLGLKIYSQVVTLDGVKVAFAGNTNVPLTTIK
ncbi:MAG: M12 family metallo-peptidase [Planctomycetota bacterium]|jgi:hypothetical protein